MEASGGIGRGGWRPVEGLAEGGGGQWRDWQRGVEASGGIGRGGWRRWSGWKGWTEAGIASGEAGQ
ncbi:unnamed protein product [Staurois parvus]|uniref:Uncharacterized protein n=1 Tax=Staurois parvus TaxID=386267 RepID=A0ABN9B3T0_9NEOB|nr:unnamed protein product [Staurois parvus]